MSDLLKITIEKIEGVKCSVILQSLHPDQTVIPSQYNIAFQIVMEAYKEFGPFENHPLKEKMDKWLSFMYRQEIVITEEEFKKYDSGELEMPSDCNSLNWDDFNGGSMMKKENNYEFVRAANNEIADVIMSDEKLIHFNEDDERPSAKMEFEVFEKELLSHLKLGMTWDSAMYDRQQFM